MKKNFSPRVQRLLFALGQDEAYKLGSKELDVEHIILAILKSADGLAYVSLLQLRINVLTMQLAIEQSLPGQIPSQNMSTLPRTARLDRLLENASFQADSMGLDYVGTEHLLLAAIVEEKSIVNQYFKRAAISYSQARNTVLEVEKKIPSSAKDERFYSKDKNSKGIPLVADGSSQHKIRKDSMLGTFCRDLTDDAKNNLLDPVIGRETEVMRVIQILCRRTKNNPILVGEPGVGKTAIVEGLAQKIANNKVPRQLINKKVLVLDLAAMIAGTKYRGEFEERMKRIMKEILEAKNVILFIDEMHTIIGAGGPEGSMDASNMLKPALSRGELQILGATTTKEYRKYFEKDQALSRRFQKVNVQEPSETDTEKILLGLKSKYEEFHQVVYDDDVIPLIVKCATRYISERYLPDKAIDILDEVGAVKKITSDVRPPEIEEIEKTIDSLSAQKRELVANQDYEKAAYVRDKVTSLKSKLDELNQEWKNANYLEKRRVNAKDVLSVISKMTGIDVEQLDENESERLINMENEIHKEVIGQDEAVNLISSAVRRSRSGVSSLKRPIGSFIFLGPTGVGKTQLAKTLAKFLFGTEDALIRVDMSDYMEKQNASRLVGSPPGYVGYEEGGMLTEAVREHPYSVVLLDEIEKAHHDVYNLLLQLLEEGELSDNLGHTVSFRNTIIIMTSNAGAREISAESRMGFSTAKDGLLSYEDIKSSALEELKRIMSPELLNRIDDIVVFNALNREQVSSILDIQLKELQERLAEKNIKITLKKAARDYFIDNGYEPSMGARPMRRLIQREIEDSLANLLLSNKNLENNQNENSKELTVDYVKDKISVKFKKQKALENKDTKVLESKSQNQKENFEKTSDLKNLKTDVFVQEDAFTK